MLDGRGRIRTNGTRKGTTDFKSVAFDHSATLPAHKSSNPIPSPFKTCQHFFQPHPLTQQLLLRFFFTFLFSTPNPHPPEFSKTSPLPQIKPKTSSISLFWGSHSTDRDHLRASYINEERKADLPTIRKARHYTWNGLSPFLTGFCQQDILPSEACNGGFSILPISHKVRSWNKSIFSLYVGWFVSYWPLLSPLVSLDVLKIQMHVRPTTIAIKTSPKPSAMQENALVVVPQMITVKRPEKPSV